MKTKLPCEGVIILQALKRRLEGLIGGEFDLVLNHFVISMTGMLRLPSPLVMTK